MSERWDGPDGQWAAFRTRYSWGQSNRIQEALLSESYVTYVTALAQETITGLHVKDVDGGWIDTPGADAWERMDGDAGDAIAEQLDENWEAWRLSRNPKGSMAQPTASPQPEAPTTSSPSSETPSS